MFKNTFKMIPKLSMQYTLVHVVYFQQNPRNKKSNLFYYINISNKIENKKKILSKMIPKLLMQYKLVHRNKKSYFHINIFFFKLEILKYFQNTSKHKAADAI